MTSKPQKPGMGSPQRPPRGDIPAENPEQTVRARILRAAFSVFMERGYASAGTLEIATRARVSKRELYALFGSKHAMLLACIGARAERMRAPLDLPEPRDQQTLLALLTAFGARVLREVSRPEVIALYRLAIQEAHNPEVGATLDASGQQATRNALAGLLARAQAAEQLGNGDPADMAAQFIALLWGDLRIRLLLGLREAPAEAEMERRARSAAEALFTLHPPVPPRGRRRRQA